MAGVALSRFGILPKDFYKLCPIEFDFALQDWAENEQSNWERMRLSILYTINPHLKKPIKRPVDLMRFKWDKEQELIGFDEKYFEKIRQRDKKIWQARHLGN